MHTSVGRFDKRRQATVLRPEEALFMVDRGVLEIYIGGVPLTVQQAHAVLRPPALRPEVLVVYTYLRRLGYIVNWRGAPSPAPVPTPNSALADPLSPRRIGLAAMAAATSSFFHFGRIWRFLRHSVFGPPDVTPLVDAARAPLESFDSVYTTLRRMVPQQDLLEPGADTTGSPPPLTATTAGVTAQSPVPDVPVSRPDVLSIDLDVFRPNVLHKKTDPGPPAFRVCVAGYSGTPPNLAEIQTLTNAALPAELKFAIVDLGTPTFISLDPLMLTVYNDHRAPMKRPRNDVRDAAAAAGVAEDDRGSKRRAVVAHDSV